MIPSSHPNHSDEVVYYIIDPSELQIVSGPISDRTLAEDLADRTRLQCSLQGCSLKIVSVFTPKVTVDANCENQNTEGSNQ